MATRTADDTNRSPIAVHPGCRPAGCSPHDAARLTPGIYCVSAAMEGGGLGVEEDIQVLEPSTRTLTASPEPMPIFERTLGVTQTAQVACEGLRLVSEIEISMKEPWYYQAHAVPAAESRAADRAEKALDQVDEGRAVVPPRPAPQSIENPCGWQWNRRSMGRRSPIMMALVNRPWASRRFASGPTSRPRRRPSSRSGTPRIFNWPRRLHSKSNL